MGHKTFNRTLCPHCDTPCKSGATKQLAKTYREIRYTCTNDECGFVFIAAIEPIRTLIPSHMPSPDVNIPMSEHMRHSP